MLDRKDYCSEARSEFEDLGSDGTGEVVNCAGTIMGVCRGCTREAVGNFGLKMLDYFVMGSSAHLSHRRFHSLSLCEVSHSFYNTQKLYACTLKCGAFAR